MALLNKTRGYSINGENSIMSEQSKWLIVCVWLLVSSAIAQDFSPKEWVHSSQQTVQMSTSEGIFALIIKDNKGNERVRRVSQLTLLSDQGATEKRIVRFLAPPDVKGTALLTIDHPDKEDDVWLYLPAMRKTRKIISSEKNKSFMGSEFTYADMTPPLLDEFTCQFLTSTVLDGESCVVVEMLPINQRVAEENGYAKRILCIAQNDRVIRRSEFYNEQGELFKVMTAADIRLVDSEHRKFYPFVLMMENRKNGRTSIMKVEQMKIAPSLDANLFDPAYLERD